MCNGSSFATCAPGWCSGRGLVPLLLALALLPLSARSEDQHDAGLWTVSQLAVPLGDRVHFHLMVQNRWVRNLDSYQRTVVRPWIAFDWSEQIKLELGYDAHRFENPASELENRAWQRISYELDLGGERQRDLGHPTLFTHFWLEERFFDDSDSVALRGRFLIGGSLQLPSDWSAVVRNEFLVDLNETAQIRRAGLGEDQLFAGVRHLLGSWLSIEVGYLMQYLDPRGPNVFNHSLLIGLSARTPNLLGRP